MGQVESNQSEGDFFSLTPEEQKIINEQSKIFECFFRHPTFENYQTIRSIDEIYERCLGDKYRIFLLAVREKNTSFEDPLSDEEKSSLQKTTSRLTSKDSILSPNDLDTMWVLYYATGESKYPERILHVCNEDTKQNFAVRGAAAWSYNSHVEQGKL